jgi:hypothetical protein
MTTKKPGKNQRTKAHESDEDEHTQKSTAATDNDTGYSTPDDTRVDNDDFYTEDEGGPSLSGVFGEGIKKLFATGLSAAFLTEESIRGYLQDVKLPKEVLKLFLEGAAKSKEQLMSRVGNEVISIIQKIDFVKEASRFVESHKFKVSAEIEVIKKEKPGSEGSGND